MIEIWAIQNQPSETSLNSDPKVRLCYRELKMSPVCTGGDFFVGMVSKVCIKTNSTWGELYKKAKLKANT